MNYFRPVVRRELIKITKQRCSTKVKQSKIVEPNETFGIPPKRLTKQFNDPSILNIFPRSLLRQRSTNDILHFYLVTESDTPKKIATHLGNLTDLSIPFVEMNPGAGLLTNLLIQSGMKDIRIFESRNIFLQHLKDNYANIYPDRIKLQHADLFLHCVSNGFNKHKVNEILHDLPVAKWEDDIIVRLYGATGCVDFFKNLIKSIVFQDGIMSQGRCELYMVIHAFTFIQLTSTNKAGYFFYRSTSILFQLLFEYEVLDQFPSKDFLPQIGRNCYNKLSNNKKIEHVNLEVMYFVKIVPRRNLFQFCSEKHIQEMWHFIQIHLFSRRSNRIIQSLEKLIPFSGRRLLLNSQKSVRPKQIKEMNLCDISSITTPSMTLSNEDYYDNLNIYTEFGDLTPSQLYTLFHQFRNLQDYSSSTFLASLESMLLKKKAISYESSGIETEKVGNILPAALKDKVDVEESNELK